MKATPRQPDSSVNVSDTHPLVEAGWLVGGLAAAGLAIVLIAAFFVEIAVRFVSVESEARFFERTLARMSEGWEEDPVLQELTLRLASHWEENPYRFHVAVIEEDIPNAMALPGGTILVTSGLLEEARSENEVAFVLAHEIGHYRDRDHLKLLGRGIVFQMLLGAAGAGGGADAVRVVGAGALLGDRRFSRGQERDADAFGLGLVAAEYGHVNGADDFFERLDEETSDAEELAAGFVGTHPGAEDRVRRLAALAIERGWAAAGELRPPLVWARPSAADPEASDAGSRSP